MKSSEGFACISLTSCKILFTAGFFRLYLSSAMLSPETSDLQKFQSTAKFRKIEINFNTGQWRNQISQCCHVIVLITIDYVVEDVDWLFVRLRTQLDTKTSSSDDSKIATSSEILNFILHHTSYRAKCKPKLVWFWFDFSDIWYNLIHWFVTEFNSGLKFYLNII